MNIIYETKEYRIVEHEDTNFLMENLKGETFDPKVNDDIDPQQLIEEEQAFEAKVNDEGVYGYILERWSTLQGEGWSEVDSCWGFVGLYSETTNDQCHYIVAEMKLTITEGN